LQFLCHYRSSDFDCFLINGNKVSKKQRFGKIKWAKSATTHQKYNKETSFKKNIQKKSLQTEALLGDMNCKNEIQIDGRDGIRE